MKVYDPAPRACERRLLGGLGLRRALCTCGQGSGPCPSRRGSRRDPSPRSVPRADTAPQLPRLALVARPVSCLPAGCPRRLCLPPCHAVGEEQGVALPGAALRGSALASRPLLAVCVGAKLRVQETSPAPCTPGAKAAINTQAALPGGGARRRGESRSTCPLLHSTSRASRRRLSERAFIAQAAERRTCGLQTLLLCISGLRRYPGRCRAPCPSRSVVRPWLQAALGSPRGRSLVLPAWRWHCSGRSVACTLELTGQGALPAARSLGKAQAARAEPGLGHLRFLPLLGLSLQLQAARETAILENGFSYILHKGTGLKWGNNSQAR